MTLESRSRKLVAIMCVFANDRQRNKSGVVSFLNGRYMTVCAIMTLTLFRGQVLGNTRMRVYDVIDDDVQRRHVTAVILR